MDDGSGVAVDSDGNIIVAGGLNGHAVNAEIWVGKYDSNGNLIWSRTYNGPSTWYNWDFGYGGTVDGNKNIYVTGTIHNGTNHDLWIGKYDTTGNLLWTTTYDSGP